MLTAALFVGFGLVHLVVNATSLIDERSALGQPIAPWQPWTWETTSFAAWLLLLPIILGIATRAASARRPIGTVGIHLLASILLSLSHIAAMLGLRAFAYAVAGKRYSLSEPLLDLLVYEYRKDAITYASIVLVFLLLRRLASQTPNATLSTDTAEAILEVRDGSRSLWLKPDEIDWVAAAGNYVDLNGGFGSQLVRRTLGEMEAELNQHGFVRIHRSRLVRKASIAKVETRQSGDFDLTLRSGTVISGSRRFREKLHVRSAS